MARRELERFWVRAEDGSREWEVVKYEETFITRLRPGGPREQYSRIMWRTTEDYIVTPGDDYFIIWASHTIRGGVPTFIAQRICQEVAL